MEKSLNRRYPDGLRCVNCGWNASNSFRHLEVIVRDLPPAERELLKSWLPPVEGFDSCIVCAQCAAILSWQSAQPAPARALGHVVVCAACGESLYRKRIKRFNRQHPQYEYLQQYIQSHQKQLCDEFIFCHPCHMKSLRFTKKETVKRKPRRMADYYILNEAKEDVEETIDERLLRDGTVLPLKGARVEEINKSRTINVNELKLEGYYKMLERKGNVCAVCGHHAARPVKLAMRQQMMLRHKIYVPNSALVCESHQKVVKYEVDAALAFSGDEIADMVFLLKGVEPVDLGDVESIDPWVLRQWTGRAAAELAGRSPALGAAALLAGRRSGQCDTVLASLSQRTTAEIAAAKALASQALSPEDLADTNSG